MKKLIITLGIVSLLAVYNPAFAADDSHSGHDQSAQSKTTEMDHSKHSKEMDHSTHQGDMIHESHVDGYHFVYHLIDMTAKMKGMKGMEEHIKNMKNTHHLMLFVKAPHGHMVKNGKVGYLLEGPKGKQKAMCMTMSGGYGADINFKEKGKYTVKAKVMDGDKNLMDSFEYEVK